MPETTQNPFRSVAIFLISLTIIVGGVIYNQASGKVEIGAATPNIGSQSRTTTGTTPTAPKTTTITSPKTKSTVPSSPGSTVTPVPTTSTPTTGFSGNNATPITPGQLDITTPTINFSEAVNSLTESLDTLRQLVNPPGTIVFASTAIDLGLPGIGQIAVALPTTDGGSNITPGPAPEAITVAPAPSVLARITGYAAWENFKAKFRAAQLQNAGTGKCMISVGQSCLVTW